MKRVLLAIFLLPAFSGEIVSLHENSLSIHSIQSDEIAFKSLASAATALSEPHGPIVYIASHTNDLSSFIALLSEEHQRKIKKHDFSEQPIVAVFAGAKGSSGYEIEVKRIVRTKDRLRIIVRQTSPKPDDYGLEVLTSPYHLVTFRISDLDRVKGVTWVLEDTSGARLATGPPDCKQITLDLVTRQKPGSFNRALVILERKA